MIDPLFSAVAVSLKVSILSTLLCCAIGVPSGVFIAIKGFPGKNALVTVLHSLLAVPTVVIGLFVYTLLCRASPLGRFHLLFSITAMVIGQVLLALPIAVAFTLSAVSAVDRAAAETASLLGVRSFSFMRIMVSEARFGILAAVASTFGRLIGEVGISMMVGGNILGVTRTMTTTIALETSKGEFALGLKLGGILLVLALAVNALLRLLKGRAGD